MGSKRSMSTVYGPVPSWRLGRSLGIDVVSPPKTCTFDCVYCQLGRTLRKAPGFVETHVKRHQILRDVKRALDLLDPSSIDFITFSGSGEPSLNPELGQIIEGLRHLTDRPVAVLTNSSLVGEEEVRRSLVMADLVVAKLDASDQGMFEAVNRPAQGILHKRIVEGLVKLRGETSGELALQMMFFESEGGGLTNAGDQAVEAMARLAEGIQPDEVQINTPTRPPSEKSVLALEPEKVKAIARRFRLSAKNARIVSRYEERARQAPRRLGHQEIEGEILSLIKRRPCRLEDIAASLNLPSKAMAGFLKELEHRGMVLKVRHRHEDYFRAR